MSTPEKKTRILITTRPGYDGFGDLYSANRLKLLLRELHPGWEIELYALRTIPAEKCSLKRRNFIDYMNKRCSELGLSSDEDVIRFDPIIHISVAGFMASKHGGRYSDANHEEFSPQNSCKNIELVIHIAEYKNQVGDMLMKIPKIEKELMPPIEAVGQFLPKDVKQQLHEGNYYFAYGRERTAEYIRHILEASSEKPIYVVVPGLKTLGEIDSIGDITALDYAIHYDINTGEKILETGRLEFDTEDGKRVDLGGDRKEIILLRGVIPQNVFMSLLYNTAKSHVLITGDMSFTEALDAGKIPFLDWATGPMTERLYGEYLTPFAAFSHPFSRENPNMNPEGIYMLSEPGKAEKVQKDLSSRYHKMNYCAETVADDIERHLAKKRLKSEDDTEDNGIKDTKTPRPGV